MSNKQDNENKTSNLKVTSTVMLGEEWKEIDWDECPQCGVSPIFVLTKDKREGYVWDGDVAECRECGLNGCASADDESAYINWDY